MTRVEAGITETGPGIDPALVVHDADGAIVGVVEEFSGLREPSTPLPAEITAITGITADMLAGQKIDPTTQACRVR